MLAMRPYGGYFYNLGRETFLAPVRWEDVWPLTSPGIGHVEFTGRAPNLPEHPWPPVPARDDFAAAVLAPHWNSLRGPADEFASLTARPGYLRLRVRPESLSEATNPSFVGRRQQHIDFTAQASVEFAPQHETESAGLVLVQSNDFHFRYIITKKSGPILRLIKRAHGVDELLAEQSLASATCLMKIVADGQQYSFYFAEQSGEWRLFAGPVDGRILSTPVASGFVGAYIAMYASSDGQPSDNHADFDWFEYFSTPQT